MPAGKVGYCKNWYNRKGEIVESDIIFNMVIAKFTTLDSRKPDSYYIEGVLAHEIGHMIGLEHIDSETSLMKPLSRMDGYAISKALFNERGTMKTDTVSRPLIIAAR